MCSRISGAMLVLVFFCSAQDALSASKYLFTAGGQQTGSDPLLADLIAVSGSFLYDNSAPQEGSIAAGFPTAGAAFYIALTELSGTASSYTFSDPRGFVSVGDDKFVAVESEVPRDILTLNWDQSGLNMVGFTINGLRLENVRLFWIEGQDGIGDFLTDQLLPGSLPPTIGGRMSLDFVDSEGGIHFAFYSVSVTFEGEVETPPPGSRILKLLPLIRSQNEEVQ